MFHTAEMVKLSRGPPQKISILRSALGAVHTKHVFASKNARCSAQEWFLKEWCRMSPPPCCCKIKHLPCQLATVNKSLQCLSRLQNNLIGPLFCNWHWWVVLCKSWNSLNLTWPLMNAALTCNRRNSHTCPCSAEKHRTTWKNNGKVSHWNRNTHSVWTAPYTFMPCYFWVRSHFRYFIVLSTQSEICTFIGLKTSNGTCSLFAKSVF